MTIGRQNFRRILPVFFGGLSILIGVSGTPGCRTPVDSPTGSGPLHLIVDAGSSGTRLCLFPIQTECDWKTGDCECRAPAAPIQESSDDSPACNPIPNSRGLATLSPRAAAGVLARGLETTLTPAIAPRIQGLALLGTGGFRQIDAIRRREILSALQKQLQLSLAEKTGRQTADQHPPEIRILTGPDEGRLAWLAFRELHQSQTHAILETGGASVQFATGQKGKVRAAVSLPLGMNRSFDRLKSRADFTTCFPFGAPDAETDFDRCRNLIRKAIFNASDAADLKAAVASGPEASRSSAPLYGLGSSWKAVFKGMDASEISLEELNRFGQSVCTARKLTPVERSGKYVQRRCYLYAFQSVLLEQTQYESIRRGRESWPRGAAISREFFPRCERAMQDPQHAKQN